MIFLVYSKFKHLQYYKLNAEPALVSLKEDISKQHAVIDNIVVSSVAMKSVMA